MPLVMLSGWILIKLISHTTRFLLPKRRAMVGNNQWKEVVSAKQFMITLNLNMGKAEGEIWTNDLSEEYVNFNKSE